MVAHLSRELTEGGAVSVPGVCEVLQRERADELEGSIGGKSGFSPEDEGEREPACTEPY